MFQIIQAVFAERETELTFQLENAMSELENEKKQVDFNLQKEFTGQR